MIAGQLAQFIASSLARVGSVIGAGSVAGLPSGAVAVWYADQYQATPRRVIPNSVSASSPSQNLFAAPRRVFNNTIWWSKTNLTVTDDAAAGPDGTSGEASTFVSTSGNWFLGPAGGGNLPAGTYTIAACVKSNSGSTEVFAFTNDNTSTRSTANNATTSWQRFSYTFTLASTTSPLFVKICSSDGATGASLQVCDLELFAGSADLGSATGTPPSGHLYLGENHYSTQPAVASNELDLANQGFGVIQLAASKALSAGFTYIALTRKTAAGSGYHATISKAQSFAHLTMAQEVNQAPQYWLGTSESPSYRGTIETLNQGYFAWGWRYDGSQRDLRLNDHNLFTKTGSVTSQSYRDFNFGIVNADSLYAGEQLYAAALWDRALTDEEYLQAYHYLVGKLTEASLTMATERCIYFEGDSITGADGNCWPYYYGINLASPKFVGANYAVSGSTIAVMNSRSTAVDSAIPSDLGSRNFYLAVLIGANDLVSLGSATYLTNLAAYIDARVAAGWKVVLCTPLPNGASGFNTERASALPTMRGWEGGRVHAIIDFAADTTMGKDGDEANTTYYNVDQLHPTTAGQTHLAGVAATVLNTLT